MKKFFLVLLALTMVFTLVACNGDQETSGDQEDLGFKIGIVTGTVSQGEEEFRAAENMMAKYGSDNIEHVTYPDRFGQETETTISQVSALASDPDVKAIIFTQAVTGAAPAIDRIKESRDDVLFIMGAPHEDPDTIAARADIILDVDQLSRGRSIMELANSMGAETFVHYSFPRHLAMELLGARRDELKIAAEDIGMKFVEVDAPDPTGDAGVPGSQQFIMEDVPRRVEEFGKDTAFFSTNCSMMEPLITQSLEEGAIFPEQCCPSPYHAYPGALGIAIPEEHAGDNDYIATQITEKISEEGGTGRFATWQLPANPTIIEAGVAYAVEYGKGNLDKNDYDAMIDIFQKMAKENDTEAHFSTLEGHDNFLLFYIDSQIF